MKTILMQADFDVSGDTETLYMIDDSLCRENFTLQQLESIYVAFGKALDQVRLLEKNIRQKGGTL